MIDSGKKELIGLLNKYLRGKASENEIKFLEKYYNYFEREPGIIDRLDSNEKAILEKKMQQAISDKVGKQTPVIAIYKQNWFRMVAAAVLIGLMVTGYWVINVKESKNEPTVAKTTNDVKAPQTNKATVTLANGGIIQLDSAAIGALAIQGNVKLVKLANGEIAYQSSGNSKEIQYNVLTNPKGSRIINITLADGTKVWLNAGSSLKYPVAFVTTERNVEITGESYFEVTKNVSMPFRVNAAGKAKVEVLGTHFNVNTYDDEEDIKVTLLEGSVNVSNAFGQELLKPGQQAKVGSGIQLINNVNIDEVMAWKNGYFLFQNADIKTIMRQMARWYDIEVVYNGEIPTGHYNGKPSRDLSASEMVKVIEYSGVKVKIDGRKIIISK